MPTPDFKHSLRERWRDHQALFIDGTARWLDVISSEPADAVGRHLAGGRGTDRLPRVAQSVGATCRRLHRAKSAIRRPAEPNDTGWIDRHRPATGFAARK